jgi:hypothetical protein
MSKTTPDQPITRRQFLTLPLALVLIPLALPLRHGSPESRSSRGAYTVDIGLLYGALTFHLEGTVTETADWAASRYEVRIQGEGDGISNRIRSIGISSSGRWTPLETHSSFSVKGRETQSDVTYDWNQRTVVYHYREDTFFLRRLRVADDVVSIPHGMHLDDSVSATLNYADQRWPPQPDGTFETHVVRRKRPDNERPDDAQKAYRAELVPFGFRVTTDPATGGRTAQFDLTRFSSWARRTRPARITFAPDGRPEQITMEMILGTLVKIELHPS